LQIWFRLQALTPTPVASTTVPVVLNGKAGAGADIEDLKRAFREAGFDADISALGPGGDLRDLARRALKERPDVLVAAGGDGTVSSLADVVRGTDTALGIVPLGTLNHFAKDLGIPLDPVEAARTIANGRRIRVDVGEVNGSCFLNNASLGLYPGIVRERERQQRRLRRSKRAAMVWATLAVLDRPQFLDLRLELEDRVHDCRAPFVFVGNNDYQLEGFDIGTRARLDAGVLTVYTTARCTAGGLLTLALRAVCGTLRQADDFVELSARSLRVESFRGSLLVATDGEVRAMDTPLEFRIRPRSLTVVVPRQVIVP
jgi:diacylglycerol kinase family enzyme